MWDMRAREILNQLNDWLGSQRLSVVGANALGVEDKGPTAITLEPTRHPSPMTDRNGKGLESLG